MALPVQAALGTGQGLGSLFDDGVLAEVAQDGVGLGVVLALAGLLVAVAMVERHGPLAVAGAAVAAASFATNGHTRAGSSVARGDRLRHHAPPRRGGVGRRARAALAVPPRPAPSRRGRPDRHDRGGRSVLEPGHPRGRCSWASAAPPWRGSRSASLDALTGTGYGRLLLVKVAVVALIAALGVYNHFRLVPALSRGKVNASLAQLRSTLLLEAIGLAVVIALTSVLVVVTPGRASSEGGVVEEIVDLGDIGSVQMTISPATAGTNQIHLYTFDEDGRPAEIAESITLDMSLPSADLGPISREAVRAGPAHFQLDGDDLAVGGTWTIEVQARVDRFTQATGSAEIPVAG